MNKVIIINSMYMGNADEDLGTILIGSFLRALWSKDDKPDAIILYNSGVKLAGPDSSVLDAISGLQEAGVDILACGTCMKYYGLENLTGTVRTSNMQEITEILMKSKSVVTL